MNEVDWLPGLLTLGIGLAIGLVVALRLRRGRPRKQPDLALRRRDLESRRDELYRRLGSEELSPGDRRNLELAAARTLRELDRLADELPPEEPARVKPATPTAPAPAPSFGRRHPALVGFVAGLGLAVLVGGLVYLAVRDSGAARAPQTAADGEEPHEEGGELPAEVRRELERLEAAAAAAPDDLVALKRLALGRMGAGLYFEAFADAETILARQPGDPDGLFIQGVVRLAMGQLEPAIELLDSVLARYPDHVQAMLYRGLALAQGGDLEQAIATWEMGLEAAGGRHPDLEQLLAQARQQPPPAPPPAAAPTPAPAAAPPAAAPGPAAPASPPDPATNGTGYRVSLELAGGRQVPPGAVLFVFLRPAETGPPVAAKRIPGPRFPLEVTLGAGDSMMGAELPAQGFLVARLDADGSASTRGPDDAEATLQVTAGNPVRLVLGGS